MSGYDVWLGRYRTGTEVVWCANKACAVHQDGMEVRWESENGQSWWTPEECPVCNGHWLQDKPEEGDDDDALQS